MPAKVEKRGENTYRLSVVHEQQTYRKTITADSKLEADQEWKLFAADVLKGHALSTDVEKMTLAQFWEYWNIHYANEHLEDTTRAVNEDVYQRIEAALGHQRLDKILPRHILEFYEQLKAPNASVNDTPLSPAYIRKHASVLKTLLNAAKDWGFIINNPSDKVKLPKAPKKKKRVPKEDELSAFFDRLFQHKISKHRLWVFLAFSLGLRREEIFGLQWQDVDLEKRTITIERAAVYVAKEGIIVKDCKTDNSYRKLKLPPDIHIMLLEWREEVKAAAKRRNKRKKVVTIDDPVSAEKWLFPQADGSVGHPHSFNSFLRRFYEQHDLTPISPHAFRHLCGSYMLRHGVDIAAVSAQLGHGDKAFTLSDYIHELQSAQNHAADVMQGILQTIKPKQGQAK